MRDDRTVLGKATLLLDFLDHFQILFTNTIQYPHEKTTRRGNCAHLKRCKTELRGVSSVVQVLKARCLDSQVKVRYEAIHPLQPTALSIRTREWDEVWGNVHLWGEWHVLITSASFMVFFYREKDSWAWEKARSIRCWMYNCKTWV